MANAKRKCTFTDEMQEKHSCFRKGTNDHDTECSICKSRTYISVMYKGNGVLNTHLQSEKHHKTVREAVALTKMTNYFVTAGSKCKNESLSQKAILHFTLLSIIIAFCP